VHASRPAITGIVSVTGAGLDLELSAPRVREIVCGGVIAVVVEATPVVVEATSVVVEATPVVVEAAPVVVEAAPVVDADGGGVVVD
jgi:hypothetical protein